MAHLISVDDVYADGYHNAFTDLLKWRDDYYLVFRTADNHSFPPPGEIVILRSRDLYVWEPCGRLRTGGDDRDPKLVDCGDRLGVVFGTWFPRWADDSLSNAPFDLISHVSFSREGCCWSAPRQLYGVNYWLWRVLPAENKYWCAAYHFARRDDRDMRSVHLLVSKDLLDWRLVTLMRKGGGCGEPVLYQPESGVLHCVIRALEPDNHSWIGKSKSPYTEWAWTDLGVMIHAPVVLQVGDDWVCAGRSQPRDLPPGTVEPDSGAHTSLWMIRNDRTEHLVTVPSAGDCSYCGLATAPDGNVVMSYYSQHKRIPLPEGQPRSSDVFLARMMI